MNDRLVVLSQPDEFLHFGQVIFDLARSRNTIPLHKAAAPPGWIPLPSLEDTMLSPNYLVVRPVMPSLDQVEETEDDDEGSDPNSNTEQEHNVVAPAISRPGSMPWQLQP